MAYRIPDRSPETLQRLSESFLGHNVTKVRERPTPHNRRGWVGYDEERETTPDSSEAVTVVPESSGP